MSIVSAIIIAAALYFGLSAIGEAIDNVAVGIEQFGIYLASILSEEEEVE
ncbi:hypothetical protein [Bradyrhizobium erythrophlei]|jgi:hypothetical protein|uniref:Uncharacterized protein n=1 Tax=Bradyrhizobium erythrophlei TaxID=1437360 RepID=A0A1M5PUX5_9BRAD|nr:hypothetical protein [Bradyrhizobium erythrophlei]SHH05482.1 hypothetical protein SAMN05443248_3517 [Bradyrhizobium erythrophlei]